MQQTIQYSSCTSCCRDIHGIASCTKGPDLPTITFESPSLPAYNPRMENLLYLLDIWITYTCLMYTRLDNNVVSNYIL